MEILLLPVGAIVGGYIITRRTGIDVAAILQEWKAVFGTLFLVVPLLGLAVALSLGTITPDELGDRTAAIIQSATVLFADHLVSVSIGAVATPIAVFLIVRIVRPLMDALNL